MTNDLARVILDALRRRPGRTLSATICCPGTRHEHLTLTLTDETEDGKLATDHQLTTWLLDAASWPSDRLGEALIDMAGELEVCHRGTEPPHYVS
jgi:hypothetical protein